MSYTTFVIDVGREADSVEEAFDFVDEFRERHFIVACQMECIMEVFRQVCMRRYYHASLGLESNTMATMARVPIQN